MIDGRTFYQILGVLNTAEDLVIRASYRSLSQKYHPDKWTDDKSVAHKRMSEINAAYEALGDAAKRQRYDEELKKLGKKDEQPKNREKNGPAGTDRIAAELALVRLKSELGEVDETVANSYAAMPKNYDAIDMAAIQGELSNRAKLVTPGQRAAQVVAIMVFILAGFIFGINLIILVTDYKSDYWGSVIPWAVGSFAVMFFSVKTIRKTTAHLAPVADARKRRREERVAAWSDGISTLTLRREEILRQIAENRALLA